MGRLLNLYQTWRRNQKNFGCLCRNDWIALPNMNYLNKDMNFLNSCLCFFEVIWGCNQEERV